MAIDAGSTLVKPLALEFQAIRRLATGSGRVALAEELMGSFSERPTCSISCCAMMVILSKASLMTRG